MMVLISAVQMQKLLVFNNLLISWKLLRRFWLSFTQWHILVGSVSWKTVGLHYNCFISKRLILCMNF